MRRVRTLPYMFRRSANALTIVAALAMIGGGAAASAAPAASGGASAGHKLEVEPRFLLTGSHGYRLLVSARGATVTIGVARGSNSARSGS
mgnify:FL=1